MIVRRATDADHPVWAAMLAKLHSEDDDSDFPAEIAGWSALREPMHCWLAFTDEGTPVGMIDARVRNYAEGAPDLQAAYVEDLWVEEDYRRTGIAAALVGAVEVWARGKGHNWLGSDIEVGNEPSRSWHHAVGLEEVEQVIIFGKPLD